MINQDKWIDSLPNTNARYNESINQLDHSKWINTISKNNTYNSKNNTYNSVKKYSAMAILFVCGLLFVSAVKNETRNLQKEINSLEASINLIKFNLDQAILDHEVITAPENISLLAKEYLNTDLVFYKRSQIKKLNGENENFTNLNNKEKINREKFKNLSANIKTQVAVSIERKKMEIRKLQELYSNPKSIPIEVKTQIAKQIEEKKIELTNIYHDPKDLITLKKIQKWGVIQVVKAFLGMPFVPGR